MEVSEVNKNSNNMLLAQFDNILPKLPKETHLTLTTLQLINNLTTQLLRLLTTNPPPALINLITGASDLPEVKLFDILCRLLDETKRSVYGNENILLTVHDIVPGIWFPNKDPPMILKGHEAFILSTIKKFGLVVFLLALLGKFKYGFSFLNECFIDIFGFNTFETGCVNINSSQGIRLMKPQVLLYLDLKTQCFISAIEEMPEKNKYDLLEELFPNNMEVFLKNKAGDFENDSNFQLNSTELDFITRCQKRKIFLKNLNINELNDNYSWSEFLKNILEYVAKNISILIFGKKNNRYNKGISPIYGDLDDEQLKEIRMTHFKLGEYPKNSNIDLNFAHNHTTIKNDVVSVKKPKQKRMWNKEEEEVLLSALKVYGPSWSKILELHGAGGSISETLKNRSQVQLKDKARNWKMHFLKSGSQVPDYLLKVTGDLEREEKFRKRLQAKKIRSKKSSG